MEDLRMPDDDGCEGQYSIYDYEEKEDLSDTIAVSKVFARAIKHMSLAEWKFFTFTLQHIKWKDLNNDVVVMDKWTAAEAIGLKTNSDHLTRDLRREIGKLHKHSDIEFDLADDGWIDGAFVAAVECRGKGALKVYLTKAYMGLFQQLQNNFITIWADDLYCMNSERTIIFYEWLRLHSDTRKQNSKTFGTKELKKMFNIPKEGEGSYMRKDGHFDRTAFERKVIMPLCKDLEQSKMINLILNDDGKPYRKIKNNHGNVLGYEFVWTISEHPRVASAKEVQELNQDPKTLKIAQDVQNGKKKPKKNRFNNFESSYANEDFDELEKRLLDN